MNSIIASNINGTISHSKVSINKQVSNGSHSSLLTSNIEFSVSGNKEHSSAPYLSGKYLVNLNVNEGTFNGLKKQKNGLDHNKSGFNKSYLTVNGINGNKEKTVEVGIPSPKIQLYTGKIHVEWKQMHKIGAGLHNLGNTCFMNTVIQSLTYCPPLANYLLHDNDHSTKCTTQGFCMMCLLQSHMKRSIGKTGEVVKPLDIYQRLKLIAKHFQFGRQEDAHEYLRYVIDNLWKSSLAQSHNGSKLDPASKETTIVNQIFGGYHRSQVTCLKCKEKSNTFDHFMDFILDIKQNVMSLEKALEKFTQPELLEEENSYKCPKCKIKVSAQKKFTVYKAPNVATFQLKRFDYNRTFGGKITKLISYPEKLNLRPYMSEDKGDPVWYRLNAVIVHSGPTCNSGHYYCYVKNSNGFWYIMDDQRVHQVSMTQVMNQSAYVLFYIKGEAVEAPTFKKCFENRTPLMKVNNMASNHKKVIEIKSSPLMARNQAKQSSPPAKQQSGSSVNINRKISVPPNQNRERISFGVRASMPNINDFYKSFASGSPKKTKLPLSALSKPNSNHSGLVPYSRDSSESSDENDNKLAGSQNDCETNDKLKIKPNQNLSNGTPKLQIRRKLSKSAMNVSRCHSNSSNDSASLRVMATSSWTVTDAAVSPSAGSSCSASSVNSTTDWHVTSTTDSPPKTFENRLPDIKENGTINESSAKMVPLANNGLSSKSGNGSFSLEDHTASELTLNDRLSNKKCDFRGKYSECEKPFLGAEKKVSWPQSNSFLKRKICNTDQEASENSESRLCENRSDSVSKKSKHTEESGSSFRLDNQINREDSFENVKSLSDSVHDKSHRISESKSKSSGSDSASNSHENSKSKKKSRHTSGSDSDSELVWVEKTKDSIESHASSLKEKERNHHSAFSNNHYQKDRRQDVISELTNNSKYFYGASVATWNGESRYVESSHTNGEKRKYLDNYEDEFDSGKVRKFKPKDRHHHYYENPFQKYNDRNYNNQKYNKHNYGNSNYRHNYKPYDSHYHWKRNQQHDYNRNRKDFRTHFRR